MPQRAIGIVRVSQLGGRKLDEEADRTLRSPEIQNDLIAADCEREGVLLLEVHEEIDISGGLELDKRPGLSAAIEAVEEGRADIIVVAYFDRLFRSLRVQAEVVARVEEAGGRIKALDFGEVTDDTAARWLSATVAGMMAEYQRRSAKERNRAAQVRAVANGIPPFGSIPPGYLKGPEKRLVVDHELAPIVVEVFKLRAAGATIKECRTFLRERGIKRSHHGVEHMFSQRVYLGEIHFGDLINLEAHEPIIDRALFQAAQDVKRAAGVRPKSPRLLARLGVLRCGTCNARMSVGTQTQNGRSYGFYRCNPLGDCPRRVAIGAEIAEKVVVDAVREAVADVEGRASMQAEAQDAAAVADKAQADLDAAIRAFAGLEEETSARARLVELREARDRAVEQADQLASLHAAHTLNVSERWDDLSLAGRREIIAAVVDRATVAAGGRGADRVTVELVGQK